MIKQKQLLNLLKKSKKFQQTYIYTPGSCSSSVCIQGPSAMNIHTSKSQKVYKILKNVFQSMNMHKNLLTFIEMYEYPSNL